VSSPSVEFQDAVLTLLKTDAGVSAIVGARVFDHMPASADYPCITMGPSDYSEDDAECIIGRSETLQVDCWVQAKGRLWPCRDLTDAVKKALHLAAPELTTHALVEMRVTLVRVFLDGDGVTAHGVVQVTALIEER
jgi:hypothetical protein